MKKCTYTEREVSILQSKTPIPIADEEFIALYHKAYHRDHLHYIIHLGNIYPNIEDRVFSDEFIEKHDNPADRECDYLFPILCPGSRNTMGRIRNMTAYLLGTLDWTLAFRQRLYDLVPYRLVFNYWLDEYVKDYDAVSLWDVYFRDCERLVRIIDRRGISSLAELEYRASEYFDLCTVKSLRGVQGKATEGSDKPRRKACSTKQRPRILSGVWGVPNKQSKHTSGGRSGEWNIRKGYSIRLLAASIATCSLRVLPRAFSYAGAAALRPFPFDNPPPCRYNKSNNGNVRMAFGSFAFVVYGSMNGFVHFRERGEPF